MRQALRDPVYPALDRLPDLLRQACADRPERIAVGDLVLICRNMAEAYLRVRRVGRVAAHRGQTVEDLALDLVADLFRRDAAGRFVVLREYFDPVPTDRDDAMVNLRRLVFSVVGEGLFDQHRSFDPGLARIIRNVKAAARRLGLPIEARHGVRWIRFGPVDARLPSIAPDLLERSLAGKIREGVALETVLQAISDLLDDQEVYLRAVPVVAVASTIRSAWIRIQAHEGEESGFSGFEGFSGDGFGPLVSLAVAGIRADLHPSYVESGKVSESLFRSYLAVIASYLADVTTDGEQADRSLYERLAVELPGLDRAEYGLRHRARLEYMARRGRDALVKSARFDLGLSARTTECQE